MKKSFFTRVQAYFTRAANVKTRRVLLQLDDRMLEDAGISKELLLKGVNAWPWRIEQPAHAPMQLVAKSEPTESAPAAGPSDGFQRAA